MKIVHTADYRQKRKEEYPSIEEQLDLLYHGGYDVEQIYLFGRKQFVGLLEGLLFPNGRPYGAFDSGIEPSDLYRMIMWISAIGMASTQRYDTTKMLLAMGYNIVKDGADGGPLYSERERGQAAFLTDKAVKHVAVFKNPAGILGFK